MSMMAATQLVSVMFAFVILAVAELLSGEQPLRVAGISACRIVVIAFLVCFFISLSPHGFMGTIKGIQIHTNFLDRTDHTPRLLIYYWLFAPTSVGFLIFFVLTAILYS
jgi:flagellar motor component MotA